MESSIQPDRITKPIQLLGAWLAGLLAIDSCILFAASQQPTDSWESQALTVAAIANVPLFLLAVFLLQTRFRPELQEDLYCSSYISQKTNARVEVSKQDAASLATQQLLEHLEVRAATQSQARLTVEEVDLIDLRFGINMHLEDREAIARRLSQVGIVGYALFGSDEAPKQRVVAIANSLDGKTQRAILRLASEVGFKKFSYIRDFEEIDEQILFGAYGKDTFELIRAET